LGLFAIGLCLISLSLMVGFSGSGKAESADTFKLELCNKYGKIIALSLINRSAPNSDKFVVHGWYGIKVNDCVTGDLPRGEVGVFAYADAGNNQVKTWGGDTQICVTIGKNFQRVLTQNYRCRREANELTVGFAILKVTDEPAVSIPLD